MKTKTLLMFLAVIVAVGVFAVSFLQLRSVAKPEKLAEKFVVTDELFGWEFPVAKFPSTGLSGHLAYSDIRDPGGISSGLPVRLRVPFIGVDSAIEDALITTDGRMDVPAGSVNVAWFALGPMPGKVGSAVIGGHYGISNGVPFVFYKLDKLAVGNKIYVINDKGETLQFVVRSIKLFKRDADATTVFTSTDGLAHLNLVTCEGVWNIVDNTYPDRRVVFTDLVTENNALSPATETFERYLAIGSTGSDVELLQTILEQKGLLAMPTGVSKGYFGRITSSALAKYQASVGLPSVGVFGPLTTAKLIAERSKVTLSEPEQTKLPTTAIIVEPSAQFSQIISQSMKSLFKTPLDAFVTVLLLALILFAIYKIIRRYAYR